MSPILEAMGVPVDFALGTLRLCVGRATTTEEVNQAVEYIHRAVIDATSLQSLNVNIP